MKNKQKILLITILVIIFILLGICVSFNITQNIDNNIYNLVKNFEVKYIYTEALPKIDETAININNPIYIVIDYFVAEK